MALLEKRKLDDQYDRFQSERPDRLSGDQRAAVMSLASDIPALWKSASTSNADRQHVIRHLFDHLVVEVQGRSEVVDCTIHWKGGYQSQHELIRPVASYKQLRNYDHIKTRVSELNRQEFTAAKIADQLNKEGLRTPHQLPHTAASVRQFICRFNVIDRSPILSDNEWWITDLAQELSVPSTTVNGWRSKGWLHARKTEGTRRAFWIVWADNDELVRLKRLRNHRWNSDKGYPAELKTPKARIED